jgi:hypothetical protein
MFLSLAYSILIIVSGTASSLFRREIIQESTEEGEEKEYIP